MKIEPIDAAAYLGAQPPGLSEGEFLAEIGGRVAAGGRKIVVLDDDPTGVQSVRDVPVLADWSVEELRWGLSQPSPTFFVLTNSRSLPESRAVEMNREIVRSLVEAAEETGTDFVLTSRSDSTLRGHYPAETDALAGALGELRGEEVDGLILCPCFFEAGRITVDDVYPSSATPPEVFQANAAAIGSALTYNFPPYPPPTYGTITRTRLSGRLKIPAK